jgi:RNase H-fold protein (predicted Holliday junction resolvase)
MTPIEPQVDNLIFDVSGMIYRTFHASKKAPVYRRRNFLDEGTPEQDVDGGIGIAMHAALQSMNKYTKQFRPRRVIACFDRPNNWRKLYMKSSAAISKLPYKGQRRQNQTPAQAKEFAELIDHMVQFEQMLRDETGIITLAANKLEADDCIAGFVQMFPTERNIIMTNDSDMTQLTTEYTTVCNFTSGKLIECEDPNYFLFEKAMRGDKSDNILNILPGIRSTKLQKAWESPYDMANLMSEVVVHLGGPATLLDDNTTDSSPTTAPVLVGQLLEENMLLMDLTKQPEVIKQLMVDTITADLARTRAYNFWKISTFCTKHKLNRIVEDLKNFRPLFSGGYK